MFGFNWIDALIIVMLVLAVVQGVKAGLLTQLLSIVGFFGSLFLAGWLFSHLIPPHDSAIRSSLNVTLVLMTATATAVLCLWIGHNLHWSFHFGKWSHRHNFRRAETILGGVFAFVATLLAVWLIGVAVSRLPFEGFSNSVSDARIVQGLTHLLPPVPDVFTALDQQVDPNSEPYVNIQPKSQASFNYSEMEEKIAAEKGAASVVRITSFGCGGLISGTGTVVGSQLVATNAHVIAGVKRPIIKYDGQSYEAIPVYFNSFADLALVRVPNLKAPALLLNSSTSATGTTVAVLGYPGGNYHAAPGIIRERETIATANIYGQGSFDRDAYMVQTRVDTGSSGGPIVLANGQVAGIVFSKSVKPTGYAFALTSQQVTEALQQIGTSTRRVSTGACVL
jgi:S1-C subfamily serine protease